MSSTYDSLIATFHELYPDLAGELEVVIVETKTEEESLEDVILGLKNVLSAHNRFFDQKMMMAFKAAEASERYVLTQDMLFENDTWRKHHNYRSNR